MEYGEFSKVYDTLMYDYPYEDIYRYLKEILRRKDIVPKRILETACGTGSLTVYLRRLAPVTAFDLSGDMLSMAREKLGASKRVRLYREDMRKFSSGETYDMILCLCDSLNYLETSEDVKETFQRVYEHLTPGGVFVFDVNTKEKYEKMGDQVFTDERNDIFYVWENGYNREEKQNIYRVNFFQKEGENYRRFFEEHVQYLYSKEELEEILKEAGFQTIRWYNGYGFDEDLEDCDRLVGVIEKSVEN